MNDNFNKLMKLISKILLLALPFLAINILYQTSDAWKNKYNLERFHNIPDKIKIANTGSSHGSAFDYGVSEFRGITCSNLSIAQQTLDFDYAVLRQNINKFQKGSSLFILISPFETDGIPNYEYNRDAKLRYYGFLKRKYFESFSLHDWIVFNSLAIFLSPHPIEDMSELIKSKFHPLKQTGTTVSAAAETVPEATQKEVRFDDLSFEKKQEQIKVYITEGWMILFPPSPDGREYNKKYIAAMISLCKEHEINPVVITPPISREAFDVLYNSEKPTYYSIYKFHEELKQAHPDVKFLNYIDLYFNQSHLFADNNHLTRTGAKDFSKRIYSDLYSFGYIKKDGQDF